MKKRHYHNPVLSILSVLKKYTDENHTLSQKQINELIFSEYEDEFDRETIRNNLLELIDFNLPVRYQENDPEKERFVMRNLYYEHEFTDGELRLLINSVLFADGLSKKHRNDLIKKLEGLTSKHFHSVIDKIDMNVYDNVENTEIFLTIENINEAIVKGVQISFVKTDNNKRYIVSPYQLVSSSGHLYLLCNYFAHDDTITHFRIDRLKDSKVLSEPLKPLRTFEGYESGIQLCNYVKEHPNMWGGKVVHISFKCKKYLRNHLVEQFGTEIKIEETEDDMLLVRLKASETAMFHWGLQYLDSVEILSPESLRNKLKAALKDACRKYCSDSETGGDNS